MDELIRGFEEVLADTAQLLGLEDAEPVRRYDPPVRPSYTEPVSHPSDTAAPRAYTGDVPVPLAELSVRCGCAAVCLQAKSHSMDAQRGV